MPTVFLFVWRNLSLKWLIKKFHSWLDWNGILLNPIYDQSKCLPFVFRSELHVIVGPIKIRTSPLTTTKADLLFLFVNEMKWGGTWKKVIYGIIKRKIWPKCYCRTQQQKTKKCKKRRQVLRQLWKLNKKGNSYIPGGFSTKIIPMF